MNPSICLPLFSSCRKHSWTDRYHWKVNIFNPNIAWQPNYVSLVNSVDCFPQWLLCTSHSFQMFLLSAWKSTSLSSMDFYLQNIPPNHSLLSFIAPQTTVISRLGYPTNLTALSMNSPHSGYRDVLEIVSRKGEWWWIQLWYIVRTLVNVTVYPQSTMFFKSKHLCYSLILK
jgi:hypothetical protein